jgi:hypothetical protein
MPNAKMPNPKTYSMRGQAVHTPWGFAQSCTEYSNGIKFYETASHGGFFVPLELLERIPAEHRVYAKRWSGSEQFFEEDVAWAAIPCAFPELFDEDTVAKAAFVAGEYFNRKSALETA